MALIPPTKEQLQTILKELNLTQEQVKIDTNVLKEWLQSQPHLPHDIEDSVLTSFIVGSKNSIERAKQQLDGYLTNKTAYPEIYGERDPCNPAIRRLTKIHQYVLLPGMTPEGYRINVHRIQPDTKPEDLDLLSNAIKVLSTYDIRFLEDSYFTGDITILDCKHIGIGHLPCFSPSILKKYVHCSINSLPVRQKKMIFFNMPSLFEPVVMMLKMFLSQKLAKRIIATSEDHHILHDHVPRELLPEEYGGKAGTFDDLENAWQLKMERDRDWFLKDMTRQVDESKRPEKSSYKPNNMFGVQGSFKTLSID